MIIILGFISVSLLLLGTNFLLLSIIGNLVKLNNDLSNKIDSVNQSLYTIEDKLYAINIKQK